MQKHFLNFDIDNYLNPICPRQRFYLLPSFISHWFGYRAPGSKSQPKLPNIGVWFSAFIGGFIGIAIITNVYSHLPLLGNHQAPIVIASFGAAAILEYNTIESPLSQPRNLVVGHFLSAVIGVAVTKGFERLPHEQFESLRWLAGSLAVGLASFVMGATKTVHPPAGATALLASTSPEITILGWWLLPLVLLASSLMCASALIVNNITRRWPLYWWTPADLTKSKSVPEIEHVKDVEKQTPSDDETDTQRSGSETGDSITKITTRHIEDRDAASVSEASIGANRQHSVPNDRLNQQHTIMITGNEIILPDWWDVNDWETEVLEILRGKLQKKQSRQETS